MGASFSVHKDIDKCRHLVEAMHSSGDKVLASIAFSCFRRNPKLLSICDALQAGKPDFVIHSSAVELTERDAIVLAWFLSRNSGCTYLSCSGSRIGAIGAKAFAAALKRNSSLRTLQIGVKGSSANLIKDAGAIAFASALRVNTTLERLILCGNLIGHSGIKRLADALRVNTTLRTLDLGINCVWPGGGLEALTAALVVNSTLRHLRLHKNCLWDDGARLVADALRADVGLVELDLHESNGITDAGALDLASALRSNSRLANLDLSKNEIKDVGASGIAAALDVNSSLRLLSLGDNAIGNAGAMAIADALKSNATMERLDLQWCSIEKDGATDLAEALMANSSLLKLDLSSNKVGHEGAEALARALRYNDALQELKVDWSGVEEPPEEVCKRGVNAIRQYWRDLEEGGVRNWCIKAVLVGRGRAGKTSLVKSLVAGESRLEDFETRTIGIDTIEWRPFEGHEDPFAASVSPAARPPLRVQFWDFAGQHEYYVTHQFFLTTRALFVLVVDVSGVECSVNDARFHVEFWLDSIASRVPNASVVVVGSHVDKVDGAEERDRRLSWLEGVARSCLSTRRAALEAQMDALGASDGEAKEGASSVCSRLRSQLDALPELVGGVVGVSAKTLEGLDEVQKQLLATALDPSRFRHMGKELPKTYMALLEASRAEGARLLDAGELPMVTWSAFEELSRKAGFKETPSGRRSLAVATGFAHDLGVLVRYDDHPALRDRVVLHPQWLIDVLKAVVRHDLVQLRRDILDWRTELVGGGLESLDAATLGADKRRFYYGPGILTRRLLVYLWRWQGGVFPSLGLQAADVLIGLLEHFELLFRLESGSVSDIGADEPCFLVPTRLWSEPPPSVEAWWPVPNESGMRERVVEGVFVYHTPAGLFERLLAQLLGRGVSVRDRWSRGVVCVDGGTGSVVRVELTDTVFGGEPRTTLRMSARHADSAATLRALHGVLVLVDALSSEWPGLVLPLYARCPSCLDEGRVLGQAELMALRDVMDHVRQGRHSMACTQSHTASVNELLPVPGGSMSAVQAEGAVARRVQLNRRGTMRDVLAMDRKETGRMTGDGRAASDLSAALSDTTLANTTTHVASRAKMRPASKARPPARTALVGGGPSKRVWGEDAPIADALALVVGVDEYAHPELADLGCAVADAERFAQCLDLFGFRTVRLLRNEEATKAGVEAALDDLRLLCPRYRPVRQLAVFFAGHGHRKAKPDDVTYEGYLCLHDTDPERLTSSAFSMTHLKAVSAEIGAIQQLWVFDCCHAGEFLMGSQGGFLTPGGGAAGGAAVGVGREDEASRGRSGLRTFLRMGVSQRAIQAFAATTSAQEAAEISKADGSGHGLFTAQLCEALEAAAAREDVAVEAADRAFVRTYVDVRDVAGSVIRRVYAKAPERDGVQQVPVFGSLASGPGSVLWLCPPGARVPRGTRRPSSASASAAASVDPLESCKDDPVARAVLSLLLRRKRSATVRELLEAAQLGAYAPKFEDEGCDNLLTLSGLAEEDLEELGLKLGHRRTFMRVAEAVRRSGVMDGDAGNTVCVVS